MNNKNIHIIKAIKCFVKAYQSLKGDSLEQESIRYLLGQTIRQYNVPEKCSHVSKAAYALWIELTSDDINKFKYRESVKCDRLVGEKKLPKYKGSSAKPEEQEQIMVSRNSQLCFRDVFHLDHIVPVSLIVKELVLLDAVTEENIQKELDKMHICRILKSEDRQLGRTIGRSLNYEETVKRVYNPKGVILIN